MRTRDGFMIDFDANEPEFTPPAGYTPSVTDDDLDAAFERLKTLYLRKAHTRRSHTRRDKKGKVTTIRAATVKDKGKGKKKGKPRRKTSAPQERLSVDLAARFAAAKEAGWTTPQTPKPKVAPKRRKKKKPRLAEVPSEVRQIHLGTLTREDREVVLLARLRELGITTGPRGKAVEVRVYPRSQRHLGAWIDREGKVHRIKIPTGRKRGRPKKQTPGEAKGMPEPAEVGAQIIRRITDQATGEQVLLIPQSMAWQGGKAEQVRVSREREWAMEIMAVTLPDRPVTPTPPNNLGLVLQHFRPAKAQLWIQAKCREWANVIWQREQSPVRFEIVRPYPKARPNTYNLVGVYERPLFGREIVFTVVRGWDSQEPPPKPLGRGGKGRYGQSLLRRLGSNWSNGWLLRTAAKFAPVFGEEKQGLLLRLEANRGLSSRQVIAMAIGLQAVDQQLTFEYWQRDASGDGDGKMSKAVQRERLQKILHAWSRLRLPSEAKDSLRQAMRGEPL